MIVNDPLMNKPKPNPASRGDRPTIVSMSTRTPIYLDYNATTPVDPAVLDAMLPFLRDQFGNAASGHTFGCTAAKAVDVARQQVADLIAADPREIVWTSGATESDNLAIKGVAERYKDKGKHIITAVSEHPAVIDPCRKLAEQGYDITWLRPAPDAGGVITADQVADALRDDTILVTIMWANNETATINDAPAIGQLCHERGVIFHTDATQYIGKLPCDVNAAHIDLLSGTAHKFYGPKGAGFLYVRRKGPRVRLEPIFDGGGHEKGMRSGTLNVPGIVGLGQAAEVCRLEMANEPDHLRVLRDKMENTFLQTFDTAVINGDREHRVPQTCNISFVGAESKDVMQAMPDIAVSAGSACTSASREASHVLRALQLPDDVAFSALRFSVGRFTTADEVDTAIARTIESVRAVLDKQSEDAATACETQS